MKWGHVDTRCWDKHPDLRPPGMAQPRRPAEKQTPPAAGLAALAQVQQTHLLFRAGSLAAVAQESRPKPQQYDWSHPAASATEAHAGFLAIGQQAALQEWQVGRGDQPLAQQQEEQQQTVVIETVGTAETQELEAHPCLTAEATDLNPCRCLLYLHAMYHKRGGQVIIPFSTVSAVRWQCDPASRGDPVAPSSPAQSRASALPFPPLCSDFFCFSFDETSTKSQDT